MKKVLKVTAMTALVASTVLPATMNAEAKTTYEIKKGKLVQIKTGKTVKGYIVFKNKLYKNGKLNKGYAIVGKGSKMKLYYNTSLKKGYKQAQNNEYLFKDGILVKGYKQAKTNQFLYKNGQLVKGYKVYTTKGGTTYLYQNGQLKKGLKTATYNKQTILFKDGKVAKGNNVFNKKLYTNGKLNKSLTKVGDVFYHNGFLATGMINGDRYENGVVIETAEEIAFNEAQAAFEIQEKELEKIQAEYDELAEIEKLLQDEDDSDVVKAKTSSLKLKDLNENSNIAAFIAQLKGKNIKAMTKAEKAQLQQELKGHKQQAVERLQTAVTQYVKCVEKVSETSTIFVQKTNDVKKVASIQKAVEKVQKSITVVEEKTKDVAELKEVLSKVVEMIQETQKIIEENPILTEKPSEDIEEPSKEEQLVEEEPEKEETLKESEQLVTQQPSTPTPSVPSTNSNTEKINALKTTLQNLYNSVQIYEDYVIVQNVAYYFVENPRLGEGDKLYVASGENELLMPDQMAHTKALLEDSQLTVEKLQSEIDMFNETVDILSASATNSTFSALESNLNILNNKVMTLNENFEAELLQKAQGTLGDTFKVHIYSLSIDEEDGRYQARYEIEKDGVKTISQSWYGGTLLTSNEKEQAFNNYQEMVNSFEFSEPSEQLQNGDTMTVDGVSYNLIENVFSEEVQKELDISNNKMYVDVLYAQNIEKLIEAAQQNAMSLNNWKELADELADYKKNLNDAVYSKVTTEMDNAFKAIKIPYTKVLVTRDKTNISVMTADVQEMVPKTIDAYDVEVKVVESELYKETYVYSITLIDKNGFAKTYENGINTIMLPEEYEIYCDEKNKALEGIQLYRNGNVMNIIEMDELVLQIGDVVKTPNGEYEMVTNAYQQEGSGKYIDNLLTDINSVTYGKELKKLYKEDDLEGLKRKVITGQKALEGNWNSLESSDAGVSNKLKELYVEGTQEQLENLETLKTLMNEAVEKLNYSSYYTVSFENITFDNKSNTISYTYVITRNNTESHSSSNSSTVANVLTPNN